MEANNSDETSNTVRQVEHEVCALDGRSELRGSAVLDVGARDVEALELAIDDYRSPAVAQATGWPPGGDQHRTAHALTNAARLLVPPSRHA